MIRVIEVHLYLDIILPNIYFYAFYKLNFIKHLFTVIFVWFGYLQSAFKLHSTETKFYSE